MSGSGMIPAIRGMARRWKPGARPSAKGAAEIRAHPDALGPVMAGAAAEGWSISGGALPACPIHDAVFWLDVANGERVETLWLDDERARWMLMRLELALGRSDWGDELVNVRGIPFTRTECIAMHQVLCGLITPGAIDA